MTTDTMTYGPQTAEVEALLARAHTLTGAEAQALDAALAAIPGADWNSAWDAVWDAARDAERDAVWDAVLDAAWGPARYAAWDAALDAALALVVRDLITPNGFTQEHYDLLTGPWRRVIGKVHPDDAPLTESTGGI